MKRAYPPSPCGKSARDRFSQRSGHSTAESATLRSQARYCKACKRGAAARDTHKAGTPRVFDLKISHGFGCNRRPLEGHARSHVLRVSGHPGIVMPRRICRHHRTHPILPVRSPASRSVPCRFRWRRAHLVSTCGTALLKRHCLALWDSRDASPPLAPTGTQGESCVTVRLERAVCWLARTFGWWLQTISDQSIGMVHPSKTRAINDTTMVRAVSSSINRDCRRARPQQREDIGIHMRL